MHFQSTQRQSSSIGYNTFEYTTVCSIFDKGYLYGFNGKEKDNETTVNGGDYDFGARVYDGRLGRWLSLDPLMLKYNNESPFDFCFNNPLYFIDSDGRKGDPGSQKEWDNQKAEIKNKKSTLQAKVDGINAKAKEEKWSEEKLTKEIGDLNQRISSLDKTLTNMTRLETSSQLYSLNPSNNEVGGTQYNSLTTAIVLSYKGTANFVHELTHCVQFENGALAYESIAGLSIACDVNDEVSAYKAQFAYDPSSVSKLTSTSSVNLVSDITVTWLRGITTKNGANVYDKNGTSNTAQAALDIYSNREAWIKAYPDMKDFLLEQPESFTTKDYPNLYYKTP